MATIHIWDTKKAQKSVLWLIEKARLNNSHLGYKKAQKSALWAY
jgi:hypothetical protein